MSSPRSRLLFALVSLIVTVLICLGLLLGQLFKDFYLETMNKRIEKEAEMIALLLERQNIDVVRSQMADMSETLASRITVLDNQERTLLDTGRLANISDRAHEQIVRDILHSKKRNHPSIIEEKQDVYYYIVPFSKNGKNGGYVILSSPVNSLKKINQQIWGVLISSLGTALIVIIFLGLKIADHYMKPIEAATTVAFELARGNYKARVYETRSDETGMLSQSINILARNLQEMNKIQEMQTDRLHTLIENVGSGLILIDSRGYINLVNRSYKEIFHIRPVDYLHRLYTEAFSHQEIIELVNEIFMKETKVRKQLVLTIDIERKHFEVYGAPIIGTNDEWKGIVLVFHDITELKKLEQMRKDFVANVSHELKTPITSIKGFAETLLDGAMKDERALEHFLSIILNESERLQSLVQELLDLSKIEQQGFQLQLEKVNMTQLLEELMVMFRGKAQEKEIDLRLHAAKQIYLTGDGDRLKQIFINLITNALTYTQKSGRVEASIEEQNDEVLVHISDTGIGIEEQEIPRIFERFYRVDKARSRNSGGTGLGLAIVKHLVEAHHGYMTVKSKVGHGTTFTVHFPKNHIG
ncbi:sensory box protein [Anoxybacillus sp. B7M1]|jgi:two-component system, OmpR family, phosphate regulon sensor histidine kinase PhoR|uniref:histidine kinase n=1 Tax=Anoxybacteroides rupiense TaxID=311460 RepID=A0ABD5ITK8_9BACL|nr:MULTISPECIES: ATP-binding protein [Anoxybacillus]ANB58332.1 sensory box protein [Anoxybacillus sp. B2M1]ANB64556.1 sensory box protein [Anoxybacillus sp. B7M1]KXG11584.1 Alkaline phosphatase synthesis sensor protein PhoR [Anoxybacillus sp. P3H1B]MBB3907086.1 two-component system phosphate regulon sensor histidine kinase PhoR [Anoxybacillus rupiensis]MED5051129.1 ATP-binding protein [Anoxybacillus rupiensis]